MKPEKVTVLSIGGKDGDLFMKRLLMAAFLCAMVAALPQAASASAPAAFCEEAVMQQIYPETGTRFPMTNTALGGDIAYLCMEDGSLYRWRIGEERAEKLCALPGRAPSGVPYPDMTAEQQAIVGEEVLVLAADDERLYGVNPYTGGIGTIDVDGVAWAQGHFDAALTTDASGWARTIPTALARDGKVYLLVDAYEEAPDAPFNYQLVEVNAETGEGRRCGVSGVRCVSPYREGSLLLLRAGDGGRYVLSRYDPPSGELTDLPHALPEAEALLGGLAWDAASDTIYCADESGIWRAEVDKPFERVGPHGYGSISEYSQGWALPDGRYALLTDGVGVIDVAALANAQNVLRLSLNLRDAGTAEVFQAKYPDALLDARYEDLSAAQVAQRIQAGDADTDVYQITVDDSFGPLVDKGYAASLAPSSEIVQDVASLWPSIRAAITNAAGEPVAYPQSLRLSLWEVDTGLWRAYFGDEPVPATWASLFDAMLRFEQGPGPEDGHFFVEEWTYKDMVMRVLRAYIEQHDTRDGPLSFQTPGLREALQALARVNEAMLARGVTCESEADAFPYEETMGRSLFFTFGGGNDLCPSDSDRLTLLPFGFDEGDTPVLCGYLSVLIVNPLSPRQELARAYIACATQREADVGRWYRLHPDAAEPVEKPAYAARMQEYEDKIAALEAQMEALPPDDPSARALQDEADRARRYLDPSDFLRWQVSPKGIEQWRALAPHMRFFERSLYVSLEEGPVQAQLDAICGRYADGQMDLDAFLRRLEETLERVWAEQR